MLPPDRNARNQPLRRTRPITGIPAIRCFAAFPAQCVRTDGNRSLRSEVTSLPKRPDQLARNLSEHGPRGRADERQQYATLPADPEFGCLGLSFLRRRRPVRSATVSREAGLFCHIQEGRTPAFAPPPTPESQVHPDVSDGIQGPKASGPKRRTVFYTHHKVAAMSALRLAGHPQGLLMTTAYSACEISASDAILASVAE